MPKSAKMMFSTFFFEVSSLWHDEWMPSWFRLDPGFSANLSQVRIWPTLKSEVLIPSRWLVLLLRVKGENRPTVGQKSIFNPIWRGSTRDGKFVLKHYYQPKTSMPSQYVSRTFCMLRPTVRRYHGIVATKSSKKSNQQHFAGVHIQCSHYVNLDPSENLSTSSSRHTPWLERDIFFFEENPSIHKIRPHFAPAYILTKATFCRFYNIF